MRIAQSILTVLTLLLILDLAFSTMPTLAMPAPRWNAAVRTEVFNGTFTAVPEPTLNQPLRLAFRIRPITAFVAVRLQLFLSDDITSSDGNLVWQGPVERLAEASLVTNITVTQPGEKRIRAYVDGQDSEGNRITQAYFFFLTATPTGGLARVRPRTAMSLQNLSQAEVVEALKQIPGQLPSEASPGVMPQSKNVTILGHWQYEEDSGTIKPIRRALVELWEDGAISAAGSTHTDDTGYYSFNYNASGTKNVYVKVWNENEAAKVSPENLLGLSYWGRTPSVAVSENDGTKDMGAWYFSADYPNWQAMDYVLDEAVWINSRVNWTRSQVNVLYPKEDWPHSHGDGIDLPDKATAYWSRNTIVHEYAHCVMYAAYGNGSPPGGGGAHAIWSEEVGFTDLLKTRGWLVPSNEGFALIEGWAEFMQAAVDNNPDNTADESPQGDLDGDGTKGTATLQFSGSQWQVVFADSDDSRWRNIESNEWWMGGDYDSTNNSGSIVEGGVASILWDIFDERNDDDVYDGFGTLWAVIANDRPDDVIQLRAHYLQRAPDRENGLCTIYSTHGIPCFNILAPTTTRVAYAGPNTSPNKMSIRVVTDYGLPKSQFTVRIGSKSASIVTFYEAKGRYTLEVLPPTQSSNGLYSLMVSTTQPSRMDSEANAVQYASTNNVDAMLLLDHSGSMYDYLPLAQDAAKQFVDLMHENDMVGVSSFSDYGTLDYGLSTIEPASGATAFSDNLESGTGKWTMDSPGGLITNDYSSPTHCWTDSPGGDYSNYANVSLTSIPFSLASIASPIIRFRTHYALEQGYDKGYVEASSDGGASWTSLGYVTGSQSSWTTKTFRMSGFGGSPSVRIRFRLQTDLSVVYDGWYIDDIGVTAGSVREEAKGAIDAIVPTNNTSIGAGLQTSQSELLTKGNNAHPWAVVLLSDGYENTEPLVAGVLPAIKSTKTVVHTVALGSASDESLLMDIASQTAGTYSMAPGAEQLAGIYNTIAGAVSNQQTLFLEKGTASQGVTDEKSVVVDSTLSEVTFSLSWSNSASHLDLTLAKPSGSVIDPTSAASDPYIEYVSGATYVYYRIKTPTLIAGVWKMRITGGSVTSSKLIVASGSGEPYTAIVTGQGQLTIHSYLDKDSYLTGQPIQMSVTLADSQPILGASVTVEIGPPSRTTLQQWRSQWPEAHGDTAPSAEQVAQVRASKGSSERPASSGLTLFDDGAHGDGAAADGVYGNTLTSTFTTVPGTYVFGFEASGHSNSGQVFMRQSQNSVFVAEDPSVSTSLKIYLPTIDLNHAQ